MSNCVTFPNGLTCATQSTWTGCRPWDIAADQLTSCYADSIAEEALNIAGAQVNVYKLLGIHEQTQLTNLTGSGTAISGGDARNYPKQNAFTTFTTEWRSQQSGAAAITASAFIGYDFGVVKMPDGRDRYGPPAPIRQMVTAIRIKQSADPLKRVAKVRVERSETGTEWFGVAVLTLPNDDVLNTLYFKQSVPSRFWRLRPIGFVGTDCEQWGVQALEMFDYTVTHLSNIQDMVLMENRDRDYADSAITLKGYYELQNVSTDLTRFGIEIPAANYQIRVNFTSCIATLGRPVVIGDIIELPSEAQFTPDLRAVKRWLEVTDVTWDSSSYTPGWRPTMLLITAAPAMASQETQDIFGDLAKVVDTSGLFNNDDGNNPMYQDYSNVDQTIRANAATQVPLRGSEGSNVVREFEPEELQQAADENFPHLNKLGFNRTGMYVEDAMPQNGAPYSEGPVLPPSPTSGEYHRLTYEGLAKDIPAKLYRWSSVKNRWVYLETDRRSQFNNQKANLEEYTTSAYKKWAREIK